MNELKTLYRGKRLLIPYENGMNIEISSVGFDNFDVAGLNNNRTAKYAQSLNITKFLSKSNLTLRAVKTTNQEIVITYKNNGIKRNIIVDEETIEINLDDTVMTLNIDNTMNTSVHIVSNDEFVNEKVFNQEKEKNDKLKVENMSLKEQYEKIKEENNELLVFNDTLKTQYTYLKNQNDDLKSQNKQYEDNMKELDEIFNDSSQQNERLQNQFDAALRLHGMTQDIFEEYKHEDNSDEIEDHLKEIKEQLDETQKLLKKYIELRQKRMNLIREKVKPQ